MQNTTEKPHVLILDDDPDIHQFLKLELEKSGFHCISAYSEEEAIDFLIIYNFTFGIFDIILSSNSSSDKVIHFLNTDDSKMNKHLPIGVMSAHMDEDFAKKVRKKSSNVFATFKKPLKKNQVTDVLTGDPHRSILLVEDDPDIAKLIKNELEKHDYVVYMARSTDQALKLLSSTRFLCSIIDNKLDQENSQAVFDYLSKEGLELNLPLILTGTQTRSDLEDNAYLFIFEMIPKPFKRGVFAETINKLKLWNEQSKVNSEEEKGFSAEDLLASMGMDDSTDVNMTTSHLKSETIADDVLTFSGTSENDGDHKQVIKGGGEKEEEFSFTVKGDQSKDSKDDYWQVKALSGAPFGEDEQDPDDINQRNSIGMTPLMIYCLRGDLTTVEYLVDVGADIGLRCKEGRSALHYAARSNNAELVNYLLGKGIKVNIRDQHNHEALYDAIITKSSESVKALLAAGSRTSTRFEGKSYLTIAVLIGDIDIVKLMLDQGLDPKFEDYKGKNCIDYAKAKGFTDILKLINSPR